MKKLILVLVIIVVSSITNNSYSQGSMSDFVSKSKEVLETLETELTISDIEFKIIASSRTSYATLVKGYRYLFFCFGDDEVEDLDIIVYEKTNGNWVKIAEDNEEKPSAKVIITPKETKEYKVETVVYKYVSGESHSNVCLTLSATKVN